jgi:hypothetical protein
MEEVCVLNLCTSKRYFESIFAFTNEACETTFIFDKIYPNKFLPADKCFKLLIIEQRKRNMFNPQGILPMNENQKINNIREQNKGWPWAQERFP